MWLDGLCDFDVTNMMYHIYGLCRVLCLFINKYGFTYLYCALWVCMHVFISNKIHCFGAANWMMLHQVSYLSTSFIWVARFPFTCLGLVFSATRIHRVQNSVLSCRD